MAGWGARRDGLGSAIGGAGDGLGSAIGGAGAGCISIPAPLSWALVDVLTSAAGPSSASGADAVSPAALKMAACEGSSSSATELVASIWAFAGSSSVLTANVLSLTLLLLLRYLHHP